MGTQTSAATDFVSITSLSGDPQPNAIFALVASATDFPAIYSIKLGTNGTFSANVIGVGIIPLANLGIYNNVSVFPVPILDDPSGAIGSVFLIREWQQAPTFPSNYLRRLTGITQAIFSNITFNFKRGLILAPNTAIVAVQISGINPNGIATFGEISVNV